MDITRLPQIPDTATEEYLEKLEEKIQQRLNSATPLVAARLRAMLEEVRQRKQQLQEEAAAFVEDVTSNVSQEDPLGSLATDVLNTDEQQHVKEGLQKILDDVKKQRQDKSQNETRTFIVPQAQPTYESGATNFHPEADSLSDQEFLVVKDRMKEILSEVQQQRQHPPSPDDMHEDILDLDESVEIQQASESAPGVEVELELSEDFEINIGKPAPLTEETEFLLGEDFEIKDQEQQGLETGRFQKFNVTEDEYQGFQERFRTLKERVEITAAEESGELTFEAACRRVSKGESLVVLEKVGLSEREQLMLWAFHEFLHQMKGVKRQQSYDMQHLTARSIRELEQIFKTYQIQGYLRAELNNIYNRLLNLRGRFSILLH
ncbi:hypothetical protein U14_03219 [Candidatus Moduliflexus flocculans]|uniref:Uncharacterized protein n=1 Tax=Candidatus Moduliflexus flocculans TaxID=1499966 RepID=A0A081BNK7_9BACT|nr:hypothetical protein U14_03219 [Candidatus Moduliflexus flocculans]